MNLVEGGLRHENLRVPRASRYFLAALAAVAMYGYTTLKANAAPMVDGPEVCEVAGSKQPSVINPDPLSECLLGGRERLAAGAETIDYLNRYYPDGPKAPSFTSIVNGSLATASNWLANVINETAGLRRR